MQIIELIMQLLVLGRVTLYGFTHVLILGYLQLLWRIFLMLFIKIVFITPLISLKLFFPLLVSLIEVFYKLWFSTVSICAIVLTRRVL